MAVVYTDDATAFSSGTLSPPFTLFGGLAVIAFGDTLCVTGHGVLSSASALLLAAMGLLAIGMLCYPTPLSVDRAMAPQYAETLFEA